MLLNEMIILIIELGGLELLFCLRNRKEILNKNESKKIGFIINHIKRN